MSAMIKYVLTECAELLVQDLNSEDVLVHLISALIITHDERDRILFNPTRRDKTMALIQILRTKQDSALDALLTAINNNNGGQGHLLDLMEECRRRYIQCPPEKEAGTQFQVKRLPRDFTARVAELKQLHQILESTEQYKPNIGRIVAICGLGGIGKSTLALKYVKDHLSVYDNVVWIHAGSTEELTSSFEKLVIQIGMLAFMPCTRPSDVSPQQIYAHFATDKAKTIFMFDNVEDIGILAPFLPSDQPQRLPFILITTRLSPSALGESEFQCLQLSSFDPEESLCFIKSSLGLPEMAVEVENTATADDMAELIDLLGGLPLALQQAVAFIQRIDNQPNPIGYYLKQFNQHQERLLNDDRFFRSTTNWYTSTTYTTWRVTLDRISKQVDGALALSIIEIMAYLSPDTIPRAVFDELRRPQSPSQANVDAELVTEFEIDNAIFLLTEYSMIAKHAPGVYNIHRLVQEVIQIDLKKNNREADVIYSAMTRFAHADTDPNYADLRAPWEMKWDHNMLVWPHGRSLVNYILNYQAILAKFPMYAINLSWKLDLIGKSGDAGAILTACLPKYRSIYDPGSNLMIRLRERIANNLEHQRREEMALDEWKTLYPMAVESLGDSDGVTVQIGVNYLLGLVNLERYDEAKVHFGRLLTNPAVRTLFGIKGSGPAEDNLFWLLDPDNRLNLLEFVRGIQKKVVWDHHPSLLRTDGRIAKEYAKQGMTKVAVQKMEAVLKAVRGNFGEAHPEAAEVQAELQKLIENDTEPQYEV